MLSLQTTCISAMPFIAKTTCTLITHPGEEGLSHVYKAKQLQTGTRVRNIARSPAGTATVCMESVLVWSTAMQILGCLSWPVSCKTSPFPSAYAHRCICKTRPSSMHFSTLCLFFPSGRKLSYNYDATKIQSSTSIIHQSLGFTQLAGKQLSAGRCAQSWMSSWGRHYFWGLDFKLTPE